MEIVEIFRNNPFIISIGDPSFLGWGTVIAYWIAAGTSGFCSWRSDRIFGAKQVWVHRLVWGCLAIGLFLLGVNKQLDFQSWFTSIIKAIAYVQGWYALGQWAQTLFVGAIVLTAVLMAVFLIWRMRATWRHYWLLLFGFLLLARFIVVRASSFYGVPLPELSQFTGGIRVNWLLELVGTAVITFAAGQNIWRGRTA